MEPTIKTKPNQGTLKMILKPKKKKMPEYKKNYRKYWGHQCNTIIYFYYEIETGKSQEGFGRD